MARVSKPGALAMAAFLAVTAGAAVHRLSPPPSADVSRGSEEAFARGLHDRELPPRLGPQRWTTPLSRLVFRNLPSGPAAIEVRVHGHRTPVMVGVDSVLAGILSPGSGSLQVPATVARSGTLRVELRTEGFQAADGRRLGALLDLVAVVPQARGLPPPALLVLFLLPALTTAGAALGSGARPGVAALVTLGLTLFEAAAVWPLGIVRSDYAWSASLALTGSALLAWVLARFSERRSAGSGPWAFVAVLVAILIQGVAATSPLVIASDATMHAHKLAEVARGDLYPVSVTQHAHAFRIPYGVSFYALLAPLLRLGFEGLALVRYGAAVAGLVASACAFLWMLPLGASRAGLTVLFLQLLPGAFEVAYSHGNYSNAFGQAMTILFFAWWTRGPNRTWPVGAAFLLLAGLAHLSSLIVLAVLCPVLVVLRRAELRSSRSRLIALGVGGLLLVLYYAHFWGLFAEQIPRLLEGGGQGRGDSIGLWNVAWRQLRWVVVDWGWPAILLAAVGRPRRFGGALDRDLGGFWLAGAALLMLAVVSPVEVRYRYALTLPVAAGAASGCAALAAWSPAGRLVSGLLLISQAVLQANAIREAWLLRYRLG